MYLCFQGFKADRPAGGCRNADLSAGPAVHPFLQVKSLGSIRTPFLRSVSHGADQGNSFILQLLIKKAVKADSIFLFNQHVKNGDGIDKIICSESLSVRQSRT